MCNIPRIIRLLLCGVWHYCLPASSLAQLTLPQCLEAAEKNYPTVKRKGLSEEANRLAVAALRQSRNLPTLALNGQATWQSDVTSVPISVPGVEVPTIAKDQYRLTLEAGYTIFDGGTVRQQLAVQQAQHATSQARLAMETDQLRLQVSNLFGTILTVEAGARTTRFGLAELQARLQKVTAANRTGDAAAMQVALLRAEALKLEQTLVSLQAQAEGVRQALALLTGLPISASDSLLVGTAPPASQAKTGRAELHLYQAQTQSAKASLALRQTNLLPRANVFAQGGYGRPGLNMLDNDFKPWLYTGVRMSWNLGAFYTSRLDRQSVATQLRDIEQQSETFQTQLGTQLKLQQAEIARLEKLVENEDQIVRLRQQVRAAAAVQLELGVLAAADYSTELTQELAAKQNQQTHLIQLQMAKYHLKLLAGN